MGYFSRFRPRWQLSRREKWKKGEVCGVEQGVGRHRSEERARAPVKLREGDSEEPERDERRRVHVDDGEEKPGYGHGGPGRDRGLEAPEYDAAEERFLQEGGLEQDEKAEDDPYAERYRRQGEFAPVEADEDPF